MCIFFLIFSPSRCELLPRILQFQWHAAYNKELLCVPCECTRARARSCSASRRVSVLCPRCFIAPMCKWEAVMVWYSKPLELCVSCECTRARTRSCSASRRVSVLFPWARCFIAPSRTLVQIGSCKHYSFGIQTTVIGNGNKFYFLGSYI